MSTTFPRDKNINAKLYFLMFAFLVFKRFYSCLSGPVRIDKHDFFPHPIVGTDSENPPP